MLATSFHDQCYSGVNELREIETACQSIVRLDDGTNWLLGPRARPNLVLSVSIFPRLHVAIHIPHILVLLDVTFLNPVSLDFTSFELTRILVLSLSHCTPSPRCDLASSVPQAIYYRCRMLAFFTSTHTTDGTSELPPPDLTKQQQ